MIEFFSLFWVKCIIRILLAFLLAGIIGAEREHVNKPAGFRTHALIGISSVIVMLCGEYIRNIHGDVDLIRLPAQLLSGIGFIGAGTIIRDGVNVKGLTTAASLLAVTCIGICIGSGFYLAGIIATAIIYIILVFSHNLFSNTEHFSNITINLKAKNPKSILQDIQSILNKYEVEIKKIKIFNDKSEDLQIGFKINKDIKLNEILTKISSLNAIYEIEEI